MRSLLSLTCALALVAEPAFSAPHTSNIEAPPTLVNPLVVSNVCPGEAGWPTVSERAGRDVRFILPTDRDCVLKLAGPTTDNPQKHIIGSDIGGTVSNPARNVWWTGGKLVVNDGPWTSVGRAGAGAIDVENISGTAFIEGVHIDLKCTCRDAFQTGPMGAGSRLVIQNSYAIGTTQCEGRPPNGWGHGDSMHTQGGGSRHVVKIENSWFVSAFQGLFVENKPNSSHGVTQLSLRNVYLSADQNCKSIPTGQHSYGAGIKIDWGTSPVNGIVFSNTYINKSPAKDVKASTDPNTTDFDSKGCSTDFAGGYGPQDITGQWCQGAPPEGPPAYPAIVGRNYSRSYFTTNDPPPAPTFTIEAIDGTVTRGVNGTTQRFKIKRTGDTSLPSTVQYSTIGSGANPAQDEDFSSATFPAGTITFAGD